MLLCWTFKQLTNIPPDLLEIVVIVLHFHGALVIRNFTHLLSKL